MTKTAKRLLACLHACVPLLALLALLPLLYGCATPISKPPPNAGAVVIAPRVTLPPPPLLVQQTEPKPVGYFQSLLLSYFSASPEKPTTSTPPTRAAVQTHTR
jgi:hypothetical protein